MDFMLNNVTGLVLIFLCVVQVLWGCTATSLLWLSGVYSPFPGGLAEGRVHV